MTRQEIKETLPIIYNPMGIEAIDLDDDADITIEDFLYLFGDAELTYESLINHPKARFYKANFDEWKEKGILN